MPTLPDWYRSSAETEDMRQHVRGFIRDAVIDAKPVSRERLSGQVLDRLQAAGAFAPHVPISGEL